MKRIYKYQLEVAGRVIINVPRGGKVLKVDQQRGVICAWILVDTDAEPELRVFDIYGTGHEVEDVNQTHVGTVIVEPFVWHVFEVKR